MSGYDAIRNPAKKTTQPARGLSSAEAAIRLTQFGPNEPVTIRRVTALRQFFRLFTEPLIAILLLASAISVIIGDWVNSLIIASMVLLGVMLNFVQTTRSQRAAENLRREVSPTATVLRDDDWKEIRRREVVPGDLLRFSGGDIIPADAKLIEAWRLSAT